MFHYSGIIRPEPYATCNGFVRADYTGVLPVAWSSHPWPAHSSLPVYPGYHYQNPSLFFSGYHANNTSAPNGWNHTPLKPPKPSLNHSHRLSRSSGPGSSQPSPGTPGNVLGSGNSHRSSPPSTPFDWRKLVQYPSDIALHCELQWHRAWTPHSLGLHWDVSRPPSVAKALSSRYNIVVPEFNSPALHKPVEHFELWPDHPVLARYMHELNWGPVPISKPNPTVLELLQAIYDYLCTPLTNTDLRYIHSTPQNGESLERARKQRVEGGYYAVNDVEHKGPFRRSDVLGSHRCFHGIRAVKMGDGKDILYFNLGPGRVPRY
ncbi:hypothetical protein D9756_001479 [Leucocoprinus leucothites]|uniref:DUF6699 domain-containing protein n=1 Tax=Leucocoprinus leucothites TaxID=201217 RepID=A0A8H5LI52_9AGAR|nr:hypothetical protein D9756_001479 [Leucoagaricus leucothites]